MTILSRYDGLVVDLDGVVVRGSEAIKPAVALLRKLRRKTPMVFVTNNSSRSPAEWVTLLAEHKLDVEPDQVVTSASAAADVVRGVDGMCVLMIGSNALRAALTSADVMLTDDPDAATAVVVGADSGLNYDKLRRAARAIGRGARFIATNPDVVIPTPDGNDPGNGATLAYLQAVTGVVPEVVGKPNTSMFELAAKRLGVDGAILVVGDQVETDVLAASRMGWDSALVLTGVSEWPHLVGASAQPTWVVRDLGALGGPEPAVIRHAREADLSDVIELLEETDFITDGASERLKETLVAEEPSGKVVGTISWELLDNAAHLRGLVVMNRERGHGTGAHLVVTALDELRRAGIDWIYMVSPGQGRLLTDLGFWEVARDRVPEVVLTRSQFGPETTGGHTLVRRIRT